MRWVGDEQERAARRMTPADAFWLLLAVLGSALVAAAGVGALIGLAVRVYSLVAP